VLAALNREPRFVASRTFLAWNLFGLVDLFVAVGTGMLGSLAAAGTDAITTRPMSELPLVIVPAYFVPLFVMMHVAALMQARSRAGESR